jgi:uncharacterized protein
VGKISVSKKGKKTHDKKTPVLRGTSSTPIQPQKTHDGFINLVARMGQGANNVFSHGQYIFDLLSQNPVALEERYRGNWVVGKIVDCIAEDMTRAGITIQSTDEPDRVQHLQSYLTKKGIWAQLTNLLKWGRLYGGAIGGIIIEGQDPATPLDFDTIDRKQFKGIRVYDRWQIQPDVQNIVENGIDSGTPEFYHILVGLNPNEYGMTHELHRRGDDGYYTDLVFHHSRVIRAVGIQLPWRQAITNLYWGESVIERINERILAFDTATMELVNAIQLAHIRVMGIKDLREILAAGGTAEENLMRWTEQISITQNTLGMILTDTQDDFKTYDYSFTGLSDILLTLAQQICGAESIPLVKLFGESPKGFNATGDSDHRIYDDNIKSKQENELRPGIHKLLQVCYRSAFGEAPPEYFDFEFVPLRQPNTSEKAKIAKDITQLVALAYNEGLIDRAIALKELHQAGAETGIWTNITDEDIEEAELDEPPGLGEMEEIESNEAIQENPSAPAANSSLGAGLTASLPMAA